MSTPYIDTNTQIAQLEYRIEQLEDENAALKVDALRYRWLRERHWSDSNICCVTYPKTSVELGANCPSLDVLDAAIDAARGEK